MRRIAAAFVVLLLPFAGHARTIIVGPDGDVPRIADAAKIARDGDTVEISAGVYRGDVAVWLQKKLTIRGAGTRPVLIADGKSAEDKAIWVFRNGSFDIENIEFRGARVTDGNGAGIRFEHGKLKITNCAFHDNQNGVLTSNDENAELIIENSVFSDAPTQTEPLPHLLYVGRISSLSIRGSHFHTGRLGHLIKSRARQNDLRYNLVNDGPNGSASYEIEFPNGGQATLVGNVIGQSTATANPVLIAFGAEGAYWPKNSLRLAHNTLLGEGWKPGWFIRTWPKHFPAGIKVETLNNLIAGIGLFSSSLNGTHEGNYFVPSLIINDPENLDFSLAKRSLLRGLANPPEQSNLNLFPVAEFTSPVGTRPLAPPEKWAPGAFQSPSAAHE
jgi:hypothetical protein